MPVTLTANYRQVFSEETLTLIDKLQEDQYDLGCMLEFIDEHNEKDFRFFYEDYVRLGEEFGFEPVDAFINGVADVDDLDRFESAYIGEFASKGDMAAEFFEGDGDVQRLDYRIAIDWEETAAYLMNHEVERHGDYYFRCSY